MNIGIPKRIRIISTSEPLGKDGSFSKQRPKQKRNAGQSWEDQLFFARLRRHTKWMFVLLALVFGVGFVAFGVGSGSTGISDIFRNGLFGGGGSSGVSGRIKDDQKKIRTNPNNIEAYRDLATLYQQKHETSQAIGALNQPPAHGR